MSNDDRLWSDAGMRPPRDTAATTSGLLARARGCLLGQLAGDALGSMVEFEGAAAIRARYAGGLRVIGPSPVWQTLAGQPTDDSELALALARTLVHDDGFVDDHIAAAYGAWRASNPFDIGGTIGAATGAIVAAQQRGLPLVGAAHAAANRASAPSPLCLPRQRFRLFRALATPLQQGQGGRSPLRVKRPPMH